MAQEEQKEQDMMRLANAPELLMENDRVRVLRVSFRPGDKAAMHSHPDYVTYVVKGGKLEMVSPSGEAGTMDFETGKATFFEAESHEVTNVGDSDTEIIVVELK